MILQNGNDGKIYEYRDLEKPETWVKGDIVVGNSGYEYRFEKISNGEVLVVDFLSLSEYLFNMSEIKQVKAQ